MLYFPITSFHGTMAGCFRLTTSADDLCASRGGLILYRIQVNTSQIFNNATLFFGDRVHDTAMVRSFLTATLSTVC